MKCKVLVAAILFAASAEWGVSRGADLGIPSGSVWSWTNVSLTVTGASNWVCKLERLNRTNQTWESQGNFTLTNGSATVWSTLHEGRYGVFRAQTTNGVYRSTNAFGAITGTLYPGKAMIGNPFSWGWLSGILADAPDGAKAYQWDNTQGTYNTATFDSGEWSQDLSLSASEGFIVELPTNAAPTKYLLSGVLWTNSQYLEIPTGYSIRTSPLFTLVSPSNWVCDEFSTNRLGGYTGFPVQHPGHNPQCTVSRMVSSSGAYKDYTLATNNVWFSESYPASIPLVVGEGFWINRATNATWVYTPPIW